MKSLTSNLSRRSFLNLGLGTAVLGSCAGCLTQGWRSRRQKTLDEALSQHGRKMFGGCAFCSTDDPEVSVVGTRLHTPKAEDPLKPDDLFDMMSVTKTFTAIVCAQLVDEGKLDPDAPFTKYLPEHVLGPSCRITVRDLATHSGGFDGSRPYLKGDYLKGLWSKRPKWGRGERFLYTCSNLIYMGFIAERLTGLRLDDLCRTRIFEPLGMKDTCWCPLPEAMLPRAVQIMSDQKMLGQTRDPLSRRYGKPQGNAGIFSTASDMLRYVTAILHRRVFSKTVYDLIYTPMFDNATGRRSFGWDMEPKKCPEGWSPATIFHSGFSGQTIAIDPEAGFAGVVLTSRLAGHEAGRVGRARLLSIMKNG